MHTEIYDAGDILETPLFSGSRKRDIRWDPLVARKKTPTPHLQFLTLLF